MPSVHHLDKVLLAFGMHLVAVPYPDAVWAPKREVPKAVAA